MIQSRIRIFWGLRLRYNWYLPTYFSLMLMATIDVSSPEMWVFGHGQTSGPGGEIKQFHGVVLGYSTGNCKD